MLHLSSLGHIQVVCVCTLDLWGLVSQCMLPVFVVSTYYTIEVISDVTAG